ncbi:MAG: sigma-54-dependent transcriptional regulator [Bdellovibrionota bacterium]
MGELDLSPRKNFQKIFQKELNSLLSSADSQCMTGQILIAEDDNTTRELLTKLLSQQGFSVVGVADGEEALARVSDETTLAIVDLRLPKLSGFRCLEEFQRTHRELPVIVVSSAGTKDAVLAMKQGAFHFLQKPLDRKELVDTVGRAITWRGELLEKKALYAPFQAPMLSIMPGIRFEQRFLRQLEGIDCDKAGAYISAPRGGPAFEMARYLHARRNGEHDTFIHLDFAAIPASAVRREIFGVARCGGKLRYLKSGTLLLEGIEHLSMSAQRELSRFIAEEGKRPFCIGSGVHPLPQLQGDGRICDEFANLFAEQLVWVPSLCDRKEGLQEVIACYLNQLRIEMEISEIEVGHEALRVLMEYDWPGNDSELYVALEEATVRCRERGDIRISAEDLRKQLTRARAAVDIEKLSELTLCEIENFFIELQLRRNNGNKSQAARNLGITDRTIFNRIQKFGLQWVG